MWPYSNALKVSTTSIFSLKVFGHEKNWTFSKNFENFPEELELEDIDLCLSCISILISSWLLEISSSSSSRSSSSIVLRLLFWYSPLLFNDHYKNLKISKFQNFQKSHVKNTIFKYFQKWEKNGKCCLSLMSQINYTRKVKNKRGLSRALLLSNKIFVFFSFMEIHTLWNYCPLL